MDTNIAEHVPLQLSKSQKKVHSTQIPMEMKNSILILIQSGGNVLKTPIKIQQQRKIKSEKTTHLDGYCEKWCMYGSTLGIQFVYQTMPQFVQHGDGVLWLRDSLLDIFRFFILRCWEKFVFVGRNIILKG